MQAKTISIFTILTFLSLPAWGMTPNAGTTTGQFAVSERGAATYSIPIIVPPGIAGMQPELALSYNSQEGNGLLGMGWSLQGLSVIHRCKATIDQDGFKGGINFDSDDRFCLDGQRLVATTGVYGADGTEYRTEIDTFTKIISHGIAGNGPAWFEVRYKSGRIFEYANTADSQFEAQGKSDVLVWAVNKVSDRSGNDMTFVYVEDLVNDSHRIDRINYGAGASVVFETDPAGRSDGRISYIGGSRTTLLELLTSIDVTSAGSSIRNYQVNYEEGSATGRSRLTSVSECDGSGSCRPASTFAWQDGDGTFSPGVVLPNTGGPGGVSNWAKSNYRIHPGDYNGDGISDVLLQAVSRINGVRLD